MKDHSNPAPDTGPERDLSHRWAIAALLYVDHPTAKAADFRGSYRFKEPGQRVEALDTYCADCKQKFAVVKDEPCSAKIDNQHLIGGDQRERVKRKSINLPPGSVPMPGPRINRRGIDAVIRGEL